MIAAAALALSLAVAQADDAYPAYEEDEGEARPHVLLSAWGGTALGEGGSGRSSTILGGEAAWAFESLDLGVAGYGYQRLPDSSREWTPVALLRITQRFRTGRSVEAAFTFGIGAGRPDGWTAWYQVAIGGRADLGPMFLGGEIAFEQLDILRLAAGLGVRF